MQAAVWHARHDVRVESLPEPSEPGPGEVLLEVAYCGICGTDLHEYLDGPQFLPHDERGARPPAILGHEFSGTVAALGPEVTRVQVGQRVAVHPALYCGQCRFCRSGMVQLCPNASWVGLGAASGGLAGWALLKEYQLFPLPEQVSLLQGALVEPTSVTMHAVTRGGVQPGDVVLVTGGGPIGQLAALNARAAGAREVYLAEVVPGRRELAARNAEPTRVLDPRQESVVEAMRSATEGLGVDVAIECSGNERALFDALEATRPDGTVVQVAIFNHPVPLHPAQHLTLQAKRLVGSLGYTPRDYERVIDLMAAGKLPAERLVTATIPLRDVVELGLDELVRPDTQQVKILVQPNS